MSDLLQQLVRAFQCLPGVGTKSAERMAYHILTRERDAGKRLATVLNASIERIQHCERCRTLTMSPLCHVCQNTQRDFKTLCIVEYPMDMSAIERTGHFQGGYFVLLGRLSPLDGVGPDEIGIDALCQLVEKEKTQEVILATSTTVEGETTAYFISEHLKPQGVRLTRIAHGVPLGGELEYVNQHTLSHALASRQALE